MAQDDKIQEKIIQLTLTNRRTRCPKERGATNTSAETCSIPSIRTARRKKRKMNFENHWGIREQEGERRETMRLGMPNKSGQGKVRHGNTTKGIASSVHATRALHVVPAKLQERKAYIGGPLSTIFSGATATPVSTKTTTDNPISFSRHIVLP